LFSIYLPVSHPSIIKIEENKTDDTELSVRPVTEEYVNKQISKLNIKIKQQGITLYHQQS
jgi:hypothetical protein